MCNITPSPALVMGVFVRLLPAMMMKLALGKHSLKALLA